MGCVVGVGVGDIRGGVMDEVVATARRSKSKDQLAQKRLQARLAAAQWNYSPLQELGVRDI